MSKSKHYYLRKAHRYLGLVLGIQFLFWTVGGLYFSWNDINKVHGDHLRKDKRYLSTALNLVSPQLVVEKLQTIEQVDSLFSVQLIEVIGEPVYQIHYFASANADLIAHEGNSHGADQVGSNYIKTRLANAQTGELLSPLNKTQAITIAKNNVIEPSSIEKVEYLTKAGAHHEYREKPLPAWAVTFREPVTSTVYVSAELGTFQAIRHNQVEDI